MKGLEYFLQKMDAGVVKTISEKDEMFNYARSVLPSDEIARSYYLDTGREIATGLLKLFMESSMDPESINFFDFAAGYGRITRWLVPVLQSVTISDLEQDMIDFHHREFGVNGFLSSINPGEISEKREKYDVVFIFSLFTHLPDKTWFTWLKSLSKLVKPRGYFIFSTHSYELFAQLNPSKYGDKKTWNNEFVFWQGNETNGRLKTSVYGTNITKESYVRRRIAETKELEFLRRFPKGTFDRYHDIYVAQSIRH